VVPGEFPGAVFDKVKLGFEAGCSGGVLSWDL
jgi:hypothetical protein